MKATIYQKSKNAGQSAHKNAQEWVLECGPDVNLAPEPLMGWTQSDSTAHQVKIKFSSLEKAKAFATEKRLEYCVLPVHKRRIRPRNYGDNFKYEKPAD